MNMPAILDFMLNEQRVRTLPCSDCDGEGHVWCFITNNPSEQAKWRECQECGGSGQIEQESEDE